MGDTPGGQTEEEMKMNGERIIRRLGPEEEIPYPLLLLADETKEAIDRYLPGSELYVIEQNSEIIAGYVLRQVETGIMEIKNIAVDPRFRGEGIGHRLLFDAMRRAKDAGCTEIIIGTGDCGWRQLSLYEEVGFVRYAIKKDFFIINYPEPIVEDGVVLRDMVMLRKYLDR